MKIMTREKMLSLNMAHDIVSIKYDIQKGDYDFLESLLHGDFEQYDKWTDEQLKNTTKDLLKDPTILMQEHEQEIKAIAKKLYVRFFADA